MTDEQTPADESVNRLVEYLENHPEAYDIRTHKYTVDFTIGDPDLWPDTFKDDELRVIRSSSVSFGMLTPNREGEAVQGNPQTGSNIHLPPAREELWEELEEEAKLPDNFTLVNGTFQLGSFLPPPDRTCTPHILITEDASVETVIEMIDEVFRLYETVYNQGEKAIKKQPEA